MWHQHWPLYKVKWHINQMTQMWISITKNMFCTNCLLTHFWWSRRCRSSCTNLLLVVTEKPHKQCYCGEWGHPLVNVKRYWEQIEATKMLIPDQNNHKADKLRYNPPQIIRIKKLKNYYRENIPGILWTLIIKHVCVVVLQLTFTTFKHIKDD
jgi:hypothetical protein